jgi:hypothetical protein
LHADRDEVNFRALVGEIFDIVAEASLSSGTRTLFALQPR